MKHWITGAAFLATLCTACKKDEEPAVPECDAGDYGYFTIGNADPDDSYDLYRDGVFWRTIAAGDTVHDLQTPQVNDLDLDAFEVDYLVVQAHYHHGPVNVIECNSYSWSFP